MNNDGLFDMTFIGLQNYIDIFTKDRFIGTVVKNTFFIPLSAYR
jgi:ABC-type sugar transport system permease subunit